MVQRLATVFQYTVLFIVLMPDALAQPAAVYVGPFEVTPTLGIDVQEDDNLFQASDGNETESTLTLIKPAISIKTDNGVTALAFDYQIEDGSYSDVDNSDYTNHTLSTAINWQANIRHALELISTLESGHDGRTADSVNGVNVSELNEFDDSNIAAKYTFGAPGARGRIVVDYGSQRLRYTTNRIDTDVLDSDSDTLGINFSVAVGAATRATLGLVETETEFRNNTARNREDSSLLVGAEWDISGVTEGRANIGRTESRLLSSETQVSQSTGELSVVWTPYEYTSFTLTASKSAQNGDNNVGVFIDRSELGLVWAHRWFDRFSSQLTLGQRSDDYVGVVRNDDTNIYGLRLSYAMRRWVTLWLFNAHKK